jgi:hypothetical protein
MAKLSRVVGSTSHVLTLFIQDSSSTTGAGLTGLAFNTSGLTAYYKRNTGAASVAVTLANITTLGTYAAGGFKEIDAANMPGLYEFHPPDAAYASGAKSVAFMLKGASNQAPTLVEIELVAVDNQDGVAFGLSRLDAAISTRLAASGYAAPLDATGTRAAVGLAAANLDTQLAGITPPSAATIAAAVRDVDNTTPAAGSLGAAVNSASASGGSSPALVSFTSGSWTVSGLPAGGNYVGQRIENLTTLEARKISTQTYNSGTGNYTFTFTGTGTAEDRPFGSATANGQLLFLSP